jgi:DNA-binding NarL/FixJ family response regulator
MTITVLVADDQPLIRAGIVMLINAEPDITVVAEAADGHDAVNLARQWAPDVVLMDVRMPGLDGTAATRLLTRDTTSSADHLIKVLILTTFNDDDVVYGALRAGASGFLLKHAGPADLATAIRRVAEGDAWIDPAVAGQVIKALATAPRFAESTSRLTDQLTPREAEVLTLMAHGLSNTEITERLQLSLATVKTHVARIIMKTGSRDRTQAVVLAYRSGCIVPTS